VSVTQDVTSTDEGSIGRKRNVGCLLGKLKIETL
jgi:hypothetical protein